MTTEEQPSPRGWKREAVEMSANTIAPGAWRYTIVKPTLALSVVILPRKFGNLKLPSALLLAADIHHRNETGKPCEFVGRCEFQSCSPIVFLLWVNTGSPDQLEQSEHFWSGLEGIGDGYLLGYDERKEREASHGQENAR